MPADDVEEIRERIVRKLQRMKKRDEEQEAGRSELRSAAHAMAILKATARSSNGAIMRG